MTSSPDLFNLIKSLTASEKRYFKIFASQHVIGSKNNYEKLFDALDALPNDQPYDEDAFKKSIEKKTWGQHLAVKKNQLEELLLKALRSYHAEKSAEGKLDNQIANLRILYDKGLVDAAEKALEKAFETANEQSNLTELVYLYNFKLRLARTTKTPAKMLKGDEDLDAETHILKKLDAERRVNHITQQAFYLYITGKLSGKSQGTVDLLNTLNTIEANMPLSLKAQVNGLYTRAMIFEKDGQFEEALKLYTRIIELEEKKELQVKEPSSYYLTILNNYLVCAHHLERFNEFPEHITKIENLHVESFQEQAEVFRISKMYRLLYSLNTDTPADNKNLVNEIEDGLEKYAPIISARQLVEFRFNICLLFFKQRNFDRLTEAINKAFNTIGRDETMKTLVRDLKFIEAIIHIHRRNFDILDYHLRNMERWLRENKLNNDFTHHLLKVLRQMMDPDGPKKINGQLTEVSCPQDLCMLKEVLVLWKY